MIRTITLAEAEFIAFRLARESYTFDEPIPDFATRFPNILESCLLSPFQMFNKKPLYKGLVGRAAVLFYFMIKNHPFQNGNKRIAMTTLFCFLYLNKTWLKVNDYKLYQFAVWVAESLPESKDAVVQEITRFLKVHLADLKQG